MWLYQSQFQAQQNLDRQTAPLIIPSTSSNIVSIFLVTNILCLQPHEDFRLPEDNFEETLAWNTAQFTLNLKLTLVANIENER